uniref:TIR domain-containing adapter molecule 1 n=1 Tax=Anthurium amnicola TaxID=1678845 RepID=A0A1D1YTL3_9ARAE
MLGKILLTKCYFSPGNSISSHNTGHNNSATVLDHVLSSKHRFKIFPILFHSALSVWPLRVRMRLISCVCHNGCVDYERWKTEGNGMAQCMLESVDKGQLKVKIAE